MSSMLNVMHLGSAKEAGLTWFKGMDMSGVEKRKRLHRQNEQQREFLGCWQDSRPGSGEELTLYREGGKLFLETWFSDGCHSVDEMRSKQTNAGLCLEDMGGNLFGEYFILTAEGKLQFCAEGGDSFSLEPKSVMSA
ncbi:hypothetical protein I6M31_14305 [Shewanella algae]|nr:hypothetical protein [Shewanella algae]